MGPRIQYASLSIAFIGAAYLLNFTRVALLLLILQYTVEAVFHACRLLSYAEKGEIARPLYHVHEVLFVLARLASITLAVLTFWYGLALLPAEKQVIDFTNGIFNTSLFRLNALIAIGLLQGKCGSEIDLRHGVIYGKHRKFFPGHKRPMPRYFHLWVFISIFSMADVEFHQLSYPKNERKRGSKCCKRSSKCNREEKENPAGKGKS